MRPDVVRVHQDAAGEWRWTRTASNGRKISTSGEAFDTRGNAIRAARRANLTTVEVRLRVEEGGQ